MSDTIKLELISRNTGADSFSYRGALHTYFNISTPETCQVPGLNQNYSASLNAGQSAKANGSLQINGPIDAIYEKAAGSVVLNNGRFKRNLNIANSGNDSGVLWTP